MKTVDMRQLLSAEWGADDHAFVTTQFGASIAFKATGVKEVQFQFSGINDQTSFVIQINGEPWREILVSEQRLIFQIAANIAYVRIMLRDSPASSLTLWQNPVALTTMVIDDGQVTPVIRKESFVTFVGDSITAGESMAEDGNHPELSYPQLVADCLGRPLNRIAYGGTGLTPNAPFQEPTAIEALWQVAENIERPRVLTDLVIVNYGTNDFNYGATAESFAFGLRIYLLELIKRFHSAKIILMLPFNGAFQSVYQNEVKRFNNFNIMLTNDWQISKDRIHPLSSEHKQIAEHILRGL